MKREFKLTSIPDVARFSEAQFVNLNLFDGEAFFGRLLCFQRGQSVPIHVHAHKDECFDVIEGEGTLIVDGRDLHAGVGMMLYVPAGVSHGLRADGTARWVLRETVSDRVYAWRALKLLGHGVLKRMRLIPRA